MNETMLKHFQFSKYTNEYELAHTTETCMQGVRPRFATTPSLLDLNLVSSQLPTGSIEIKPPRPVCGEPLSVLRWFPRLW